MAVVRKTVIPRRVWERLAGVSGADVVVVEFVVVDGCRVLVAIVRIDHGLERYMTGLTLSFRHLFRVLDGWGEGITVFSGGWTHGGD